MSVRLSPGEVSGELVDQPKRLMMCWLYCLFYTCFVFMLGRKNMEVTHYGPCTIYTSYYLLELRTVQLDYVILRYMLLLELLQLDYDFDFEGKGVRGDT